MEMIKSLGINSTAIIQFGIFVVTFFTLRLYVFAPYHKALLLRQEKTKGGEEIANDYVGKTAELQSVYQNEARAINSQISSIYDKNKTEAVAEADQMVQQARAEAQKIVETSRAAIQQAVSTAAKTLQGQTSAMALSITNKLLGK